MTIKSLIYFSATGQLYHGSTFLARGYSGKGEGLNNPLKMFVPNVGPLPCGTYRVGKSYTSKKTGPVSLRLIPDASTEMGGRSGFLIHGDNAAGNQTASEGCIIMPRPVRQYIAALEGNDLTVFPF